MCQEPTAKRDGAKFTLTVDSRSVAAVCSFSFHEVDMCNNSSPGNFKYCILKMSENIGLLIQQELQKKIILEN